MALVEIENLSVEFPTQGGVMRAVDGVSLTLDEGEVLGVVGESGSGKSVTMLALMGLIPFPGRVRAGKLDEEIAAERVLTPSNAPHAALRHGDAPPREGDQEAEDGEGRPGAVQQIDVLRALLEEQEPGGDGDREDRVAQLEGGHHAPPSASRSAARGPVAPAAADRHSLPRG